MRKPIGSNVSRIARNQAFTGVATLIGTLIGLVASIRSEDEWLRASAIASTVLLAGIFFYIAIQQFKFALSFLRWQFFFGLGSGVLLATGGFLIFDPVSQYYDMFGNYHSVEVTASEPENNGILSNASDDIKLFFSKDMSDMDRRTFDISIKPHYPIEGTWILPDWPPDASWSRELRIGSGRYFGNARVKRFDYGVTYRLEIKSPMLKHPKITTFKVPEK